MRNEMTCCRVIDAFQTRVHYSYITTRWRVGMKPGALTSYFYRPSRGKKEVLKYKVTFGAESLCAERF